MAEIYHIKDRQADRGTGAPRAPSYGVLHSVAILD
jgi:hypothetical protein